MLRTLLTSLRTRCRLARLSDRLLRDIGIEPARVRPAACGPSPLVPQPALLWQLRDPPAAAPTEPEGQEPRRSWWIIHLRALETRPI